MSVHSCTNLISDCRPGPADVMFLVDTSLSQSEAFNRTVDYMTRLVSQIPIGPDDFQIALVSYTFDPKLVFNFTTHLSNSSLVHALTLIKSERGPTMTSKALQYASQVNIMNHNRDLFMQKLHFYIDLNENENINKFMKLVFGKIQSPLRMIRLSNSARVSNEWYGTLQN